MLAANPETSLAINQAGISQPRLFLQLESIALTVAILTVYAWLGFNGWLMLALFLVPDLAFFGWIIDEKFGATLYNIAHFAGISAALILGGLFSGTDTLLMLGLIHAIHITVDRSVGYGFKYLHNIRETHITRL